MLKIALIGCGAIGVGVLELLAKETRLRFTQVVVPSPEHGRVLGIVEQFAQHAMVGPTINFQQVDLVVECAGHAAITEHVVPALARGTPCIIASVGAFSDAALAQSVADAAKRGQTSAQLISGAIGAIDALDAARLGGLDFVRYTGRKPPQAWKGTPAAFDFNLDKLSSAQLIFSGNAGDAARLYPKNANVAATIALAGVGMQDTRVELFADPAVTENVHHVEAKGAFGEMHLTLWGRPLLANPKTSALTVFSVAKALMDRVEPVTR